MPIDISVYQPLVATQFHPSKYFKVSRDIPNSPLLSIQTGSPKWKYILPKISDLSKTWVPFY